MAAFFFFSMAHEFGHWLAAEVTGAKGGKFGFRVLRKKSIPLLVPTMTLSNEAIASVSCTRRRIIFISGVAAEVVCMLSIWYFLPDFSLRDSIQNGVFFALAFRLSICPLNLLPFSIGDARSDGWRVIHPESID
ncbi:hypothetical protein [Undibacterium sp. Ji49W]|uniref:hypothetical protein n=1 Tax=Undibacterium sp. Ji49W TaxID=3413040 RepID=UPI003BF1C702